MKFKLYSIFCITVLSVNAMAQEDGVFLSLTRKAQQQKIMPSNISVITEKEIEKKKPESLGKLLVDEVGISMGKYGGLGATNNIMFRGSSSEQVLVMIDGRRLNEPGLGIVNLSIVPIDNIERIEIIRGASSAIYGTSAFGGMINIITKKPQSDTPETKINYSIGSFETSSFGIEFQAKNEKNSFILSSKRDISQGYRENSNFEGQSIFVKAGRKTEKTGDFTFSCSLYTSKLGVPGSGPSLDNYNGTLEKTASTPNAYQKENNKSLRAENTSKLDAGILKSSIYFNSSKRDYVSPSWFLDTRNDSSVGGCEIRLETNIADIGVESTNEFYKQYDNILQYYPIDKNRSNNAVYVQKIISQDKLSIIPSIRYDNNSIFGTVFTPSITAVYNLNDSLKLSSNAGKAWRSPTFDELYYPLDSMGYHGNPDLKPEEGISFDLGATLTSKSFKTSLTGFYIETDNLISWSLFPENLSSSRQTGAEFEMKHRILSGLYQNVNYTYLDAQDTKGNRQLNYRPRNTLNYSLTYQPTLDLSFNASVNNVDSQDTWNSWGGPKSLPCYTVVNLKSSYSLDKNIEFWVSVDNLTDTKYQTRLYYPLPGQTYAMGIKVAFTD